MEHIYKKINREYRKKLKILNENYRTNELELNSQIREIQPQTRAEIVRQYPDTWTLILVNKLEFSTHPFKSARVLANRDSLMQINQIRSVLMQDRPELLLRSYFTGSEQDESRQLREYINDLSKSKKQEQHIATKLETYGQIISVGTEKRFCIPVHFSYLNEGNYSSLRGLLSLDNGRDTIALDPEVLDQLPSKETFCTTLEANIPIPIDNHITEKDWNEADLDAGILGSLGIKCLSDFSKDMYIRGDKFRMILGK